MELMYEQTQKAWLCPNGEVKSMIDIRDRVPLSVRHIFTSKISDKQQQVMSGLALTPEWVQESLFALDPYLRIRWDFFPPKDKGFQPSFLIERVDTALRAWLPIFWHVTDDGAPKRLSLWDVYDILQTLREADMRQAESPEEYIAMKRERARLKRQENDRRGEARILAAVDSLTTRQIKQFVEVERAIKFGETIRAKGSDAAFLNMVWDRQKQFGYAPIPGSQAAFNPGMAPGKYSRK